MVRRGLLALGGTAAGIVISAAVASADEAEPVESTQPSSSDASSPETSQLVKPLVEDVTDAVDEAVEEVPAESAEPVQEAPVETEPQLEPIVEEPAPEPAPVEEEPAPEPEPQPVVEEPIAEPVVEEVAPEPAPEPVTEQQAPDPAPEPELQERPRSSQPADVSRQPAGEIQPAESSTQSAHHHSPPAREELAEPVSEPVEAVETLLEIAGEETVRPDEHSDAGQGLVRPDVIRKPVDDLANLLEDDVAAKLLNPTIDGVADVTDELQVPVVGDTLRTVNGEVVVPIVDGTLGVVGRTTHEVVLPVVDGTLGIVDVAVDDVAVPVIEGTLGIVDDTVDDVVGGGVVGGDDDSLIDLPGLLPSPELSDDGNLLDVQPAPERDERDEKVRASSDLTTQASADALAFLRDDVSTASAANAQDSKDARSDSASGSFQYAVGGADSGAATSSTVFTGGSLGGVDIAPGAWLPTARFLIVQQAHGPPGLLERSENPGVRPD